MAITINQNPLPSGYNPFILKKTIQKKPGYNIATMMRTRDTKGDIGIEIEVEGNKFPKAIQGVIDQTGVIPAQWCYHKDGSLRGEDNAEYVLVKPLKFEDAGAAIADLWKMFSTFGSVLDESNRTSVHVHLNAQKWHLNRVCAFAALYISIEEILTEWCGDHRVGNLFCLRAKDAPTIVSKLKNFLKYDGEFAFPDGLHYAGLNVQALCKFGSIEVRALRGCTDQATILNWIGILERLYRLSAEFPDPRSICDNFSGGGPLAYLQMVLGDKTQVVKEGVSWDNQRMMQSLYEGIRLAQDLCYCREWSEYTPVDTSPDPFQREVKTYSAGMSDAATLSAQWAQFAINAPTAMSMLSSGHNMLPTTSPITADQFFSDYPPNPEHGEEETEAYAPDQWIEEYFDEDE